MPDEPTIIKGYLTDLTLNSRLGPPDVLELGFTVITDKITTNIFKINTAEKLRFVIVKDFK